MTDKIVTTNIDSNIVSIQDPKELEALFEKIKVQEPSRFAFLETSGELDRQRALIAPKVEPKVKTAETKVEKAKK